MPVQPLPKSNASADFLAMLLTVKYVDGLPLTRFNKVLNRYGAPVPVQTLARWVIGSAEKVLQPLLKEASVEERHLARQSLSLPILAELRAWLDKTQPAVVPKSALGTALSYMNSYWDKLTRYAEACDLPVDNNRCENAIRPFVIGRKAWLFSDTPAGANASAIIYSMVETVKANGLDPYVWPRRVMRDLPSARTVEEVETLLPWKLHAADLTVEMVR